MVEPNYKNKYPPIGLMKISTYYKVKGSCVDFRKGIIPVEEVKKYDRVLITTLFTFDFALCIATIQFYIKALGVENVYVGGIAATIMPEKFRESVPEIQLITGQLYSSTLLGYKDDVNIDLLELDYDMLWDIDYRYPMEDSYFIYTSRGCIRKCPFCAVRILEPHFIECNNIEEQIDRVDREYGVKRNLLIMDNNFLHSSVIQNVIDSLKRLGFERGNNKVKKNNIIRYYLRSLLFRFNEGREYGSLLSRIKTVIKSINVRRVSKEHTQLVQELLQNINLPDKEVAHYLLTNDVKITNFFDQYFYQKITRYVDFNQGLDARLFDENKAKLLSELALKPCRIAFDDIKLKEVYFAAIDLAYKQGIRYFSNYLLYNFNDGPEELWQRLSLNIDFCEKHSEMKLFSFPMKYAAIDRTDRDYVGEKWNRKYLRAINVILNVTKGIVAKEKDFFVRAFGSSENEFLEILLMPDEFIRFRDFFDDTGLIKVWKMLYSLLTEQEKLQLIDILERMVGEPEVLDYSYGNNIDIILPLYKLTKFKVENNNKYFEHYVSEKMSEVEHEYMREPVLLNSGNKEF